MKVDDIPSLVKHGNNELISDKIINIPYPYREPDAAFRLSYVVKGFKERSRFVFAVCQKENNDLIGEISLHLRNKTKAEIGFWLGESFWGNGLITEAGEAILEFGFNILQLEEIYATCHQDNLGSNKVCTKLEMQLIGNTGKVNTYTATK
jgi:RimJ/RimL family protein N-acetyltransferase